MENKPHTSKSMFNCKCKHQNCCLQMEIAQCRCWKVCQMNYSKCTNKLIRWIRNFTLPSVFISCGWVLVLNNSRRIRLTSLHAWALHHVDRLSYLQKFKSMPIGEVKKNKHFFTSCIVNTNKFLYNLVQTSGYCNIF